MNLIPLLLSLIVVNAYTANVPISLNIRYYQTARDAQQGRHGKSIKVPVSPTTILADIEDYISKQVGPGFLMRTTIHSFFEKINKTEAKTPVENIQNLANTYLFILEPTDANMPKQITIQYYKSRKDWLADKKAGFKVIPISVHTKLKDVETYLEKEIGKGMLMLGSELATNTYWRNYTMGDLVSIFPNFQAEINTWFYLLYPRFEG